MRNLNWDKYYGAHKSTKQASYGRLRMGKSFMQSYSSSTFWQLISLVSLLLFEGFEGDVFFRASAHANLKSAGSRATVIT